MSAAGPNLLEVTVHASRGIIANDHGGVSDPIVHVQVGGSKRQSTPIVKKSLNPVWNCPPFAFPCTDAAAHVVLELEDDETCVQPCRCTGRTRGLLGNIVEQVSQHILGAPGAAPARLPVRPPSCACMRHL